MSAEKNLRLVQDMYAAFGRGDVQFVLEQIDDDCDGWGVVSSLKHSNVPWHKVARLRILEDTAVTSAAFAQ